MFEIQYKLHITNRTNMAKYTYILKPFLAKSYFGFDKPILHSETKKEG